VGEGILVVDRDNRVTLANQRFSEMWRIPPVLMASRDDDKLLGFVLDQLIDPEGFLAKVKMLYGTEDEDFDTLQFKDGRVFERISRPLIQEGKLAGRVWSFRDVTQLRNIEQALLQNQQRYRKLFQFSNDAILVHTMNGRIVDANAHAIKLFGFIKADLLRLNVIDLHPRDALRQSQKAFETIRRDGFVNFEIPFVKKSGEVFHAVVSSSMFDVGRETLIQGIVRDFCDKQTAQAEIERISRLESSQRVSVYK
jgi:PAS domain S-box-containing protein